MGAAQGSFPWGNPTLLECQCASTAVAATGQCAQAAKVASGLQTNMPALQLACSELLRSSMEGDSKGIRAALKNGAWIETRRPIQFACSREDEDIEVQHVTSDGTILNDDDERPNGVDRRSGLTPLMHAAVRGHLNAVHTLLCKGANPNAQDEDGMTPAHYAAMSGSTAVFKLLVNSGADQITQDDYGRTPLSLVPKETNVDFGAWQIEATADRMLKLPNHLKQQVDKDRQASQRDEEIPRETGEKQRVTERQVMLMSL